MPPRSNDWIRSCGIIAKVNGRADVINLLLRCDTAMAIDCLTLQSDLSAYSARWQGTALSHEVRLHQLAPYIGKIKSTMAATLVAAFTKKHQTLYDPFAGCGTVALAGWMQGRNVIANDLSPYAALLTRAKLFPPNSIEDAIREIDAVEIDVPSRVPNVDLRKVPGWVRDFFHPETLREVIAWFELLDANHSDFAIACLLGILHHQRPGFLSYPSSHTVPYLRKVKFPPQRFPELYEYRSVRDRLEKKIRRAFQNLPSLDQTILRECHQADATRLKPAGKIDAIITSPPYMRQLDYGRDNRLRLWFLGETEWQKLDNRISPREAQFLKMMKQCFRSWRNILSDGGYCVLILGDAMSRTYNEPLAVAIAKMATSEVGGYRQVNSYSEPIPANRRVRRGYTGSETETILVLERES